MSEERNTDPSASELQSATDPDAPVLPTTVEEAARPVRLLPATKSSPGPLIKEKGQRLLRKGVSSIGDSEDAEEHTDSRRRPSAKASAATGASLSESEDAEESRHEHRTHGAGGEENSEADEYSYIGGQSRSESGKVHRASASSARRHNNKQSELDDGVSEEVSVSESLMEKDSKKESSRRAPAKVYSNKSYEESTDAESASESELPMRDAA